MSNSTNKKQIEILLQRMRENPSIAGGYSKESKEDVAAFWKKINLELNSAGPPVKCIMEWKKVWNDQKRYVRKKAAENLKQRDGTGGGPCKIKKLNPTEEAIYEIVKMKESVEGVQNASVFGLPASLQLENKENELAVDLDVQNSTNEQLNNDILPSNSASHNRKLDNACGKKVTPECFGDVSSKVNATQLVEKEIKIQENLCNKICDLIEIVKEEKAETKAIMKRICRSLEKINDNENKKIKEIKRHNSVMENIEKRKWRANLKKTKKLLKLRKLN